MKIAIQERQGSFSDRWIAFCKRRNLPYKIVNAFDSDIIGQLNGCAAFMWHHHHAAYEDAIAAKRILFALEHAGMAVFPDFKTGWHFDDKIAQKYLFESIDAPLVKSYVFFDEQRAREWASSATYPKVFKLKGGAGSANVKLVQTVQQAHCLIRKAFARGFPQYDGIAGLQERYYHFRRGEASYLDLLKGAVRLLVGTSYSRRQCNERGYVYFQDFLRGNTSDIRIIVIGRRAFGIRRLVRDGDFRASGSGQILYRKEDVDERCVKIAFNINDKLQSQCAAFDFIFDHDNLPHVVEVSYGYTVEVYDQCPGYWDPELNWHEGLFIPQEWILDDLIGHIRGGGKSAFGPISH